MTPQDSPASFGATSAEPPVLSVVSSAISIIFKWAALLPLTIYLASSLSHRLVGQAALTGYVPIALFPRLGVLRTIANFLQQGQEFLDRASTGNDLRRKVWDVNWGRIFPCANGAVAAMLGAHAFRNVNVQKVPEEVDQIAGSGETFESLKPKSPFRRYQKLHILRFSETEKRISHARWFWNGLPTVLEDLPHRAAGYKRCLLPLRALRNSCRSIPHDPLAY